MYQVVEETNLAGVVLVSSEAHEDPRGSLLNLYTDEKVAALKVEFSVAQINVALLRTVGVTKGMHLQFGPWAETKLVSCLEGSIFDVAVDLRINSATFGCWFGRELKGNDGLTLVIPPGCAHGVQALSAGAIVHYVHSKPYMPDAEGGIHALDSEVAIAWPLPPVGLSVRDRNLPTLAKYREEHP